MLGVSAGHAISLSPEERLRHLAVLGMTGVGKTTLLTAIMAQDIHRGDALVFFDPNGDAAENLLSLVPPRRANHVCYLNLADYAHPVAMNLLEDVEPDSRHVLAQSIVAAFKHGWPDVPLSPSAERIFLHALTAVMESTGGTLMHVRRFLTDAALRAAIVGQLESPITRAFFTADFEAWDEEFRERCLSPVLTRLDLIAASPALRNVLGQSRSKLHLDYAADNGRVVIINAAKGIVGEQSAFLFGGLVLARLQLTAMARARAAAASRRVCHVVIDEAHSLAAESVAGLLLEGRKYAMSIALATQTFQALALPLQRAVRGSLGSLVVFRCGLDDGEMFAPEFNRLHEDFNPNAFAELDVGRAMVRTPSWSGHLHAIGALDPLGDPESVRKQSRRHYTRPRAAFEAKLIHSILPAPGGQPAPRLKHRARKVPPLTRDPKARLRSR